jgi:hypothetical protein
LALSSSIYNCFLIKAPSRKRLKRQLWIDSQKAIARKSPCFHIVDAPVLMLRQSSRSGLPSHISLLQALIKGAQRRALAAAPSVAIF